MKRLALAAWAACAAALLFSQLKPRDERRRAALTLQRRYVLRRARARLTEWRRAGAARSVQSVARGRAARAVARRRVAAALIIQLPVRCIRARKALRAARSACSTSTNFSRKNLMRCFRKRVMSCINCTARFIASGL